MAILPTSNDVRPVDPVLTNLSVAFKNASPYIWDKIAPVTVTNQKTGTYFIYPRDYWFRTFGVAGGAARAEGAEYKRIGMGVTTSTYATLEYGFERVLDDTMLAASQTPEDQSTVATQFLTNQIQNELEVLTAATTFVTGVWGTSTSLTGTSQWSDYANSDPITAAMTAHQTVRRNTGATPNKLYIGASGWDDLREHPLLLEKFKYTQKGILTEDLIAPVLGVDEIIVGRTVKNTANENATFAGGDIWTDNALFVVQNSPSLMVANGATSFIWTENGRVGGTPPWAFDTYREDRTRGEVVRVMTHYVPKVISSAHGYMYLDTGA